VYFLFVDAPRTAAAHRSRGNTVCRAADGASVDDPATAKFGVCLRVRDEQQAVALRRAVHADIGHCIEPFMRLPVQVAEVLETACKKEVLTDIAVGTRNLAPGPGAIRLARTWRKTV
jgi:hypothetical protein